MPQFQALWCERALEEETFSQEIAKFQKEQVILPQLIFKSIYWFQFPNFKIISSFRGIPETHQMFEFKLKIRIHFSLLKHLYIHSFL